MSDAKKYRLHQIEGAVSHYFCETALNILFVVFIVQCCCYKAAEKWMRLVGTGFELGVKLPSNKPRMLGNFHHLNDMIVG